MSAALPPAGAPMAGAAAAAAAHRSERGSLLALRLIAWIALTLGRPVARLLLHPITLYFMLAAPEPRRHSARYLRRVLGHAPRWSEQYRHFHCFASTVLDRVYFVRGQVEAFDLQVRTDAGCQAVRAAGRGVFLVGAHLGSFESLHGAGKVLLDAPVTMVMYPENARKIHSVLQALAPDFKLAVIAIGKPGSTLAIRDALDAGCAVGMLADRIAGTPAATESARAATPRESARAMNVEVPFLGQPALFSEGPLRLAMLLRRPVIFMVGLYLGGRRYELRFETLADFSEPPADAAAREQLVHQALRDYVARLEALCHEAPYNWFNFHDFWREDPAA